MTEVLVQVALIWYLLPAFIFAVVTFFFLMWIGTALLKILIKTKN